MIQWDVTSYAVATGSANVLYSETVKYVWSQTAANFEIKGNAGSTIESGIGWARTSSTESYYNSTTSGSDSSYSQSWSVVAISIRDFTTSGNTVSSTRSAHVKNGTVIGNTNTNTVIVGASATLNSNRALVTTTTRTTSSSYRPSRTNTVTVTYWGTNTFGASSTRVTTRTRTTTQRGTHSTFTATRSSMQRLTTGSTVFGSAMAGPIDVGSGYSAEPSEWAWLFKSLSGATTDTEYGALSKFADSFTSTTEVFPEQISVEATFGPFASGDSPITYTARNSTSELSGFDLWESYGEATGHIVGGYDFPRSSEDAVIYSTVSSSWSRKGGMAPPGETFNGAETTRSAWATIEVSAVVVVSSTMESFAHLATGIQVVGRNYSNFPIVGSRTFTTKSTFVAGNLNTYISSSSVGSATTLWGKSSTSTFYLRVGLDQVADIGAAVFDPVYPWGAMRSPSDMTGVSATGVNLFVSPSISYPFTESVQDGVLVPVVYPYETSTRLDGYTWSYRWSGFSLNWTKLTTSTSFAEGGTVTTTLSTTGVGSFQPFGDVAGDYVTFDYESIAGGYGAVSGRSGSAYFYGSGPVAVTTYNAATSGSFTTMVSTAGFSTMNNDVAALSSYAQWSRRAANGTGTQRSVTTFARN